MESFFKEIEDFFNTGDQEVRTWFLIRQSYLPFILSGFYVFFSVKLGPALMKNRKPFELRTVMVVFNILLVAVYTVCLLMEFWYLKDITREQFCKEAGIKEGATYTLKCICWVAYMLKYIEYLDTVFFILRKKQNQVTFLHVTHHAFIPILGWLIFRTEKSGMQTIPLIINEIVHIVMYSYYGLAAIGPRFRKYLWWKKYLTQLQMVQFVLIILFLTVVAPLSGCSTVHFNNLVHSAFTSFMFYSFYRFYNSNIAPTRKSIEIDEKGAIKNDIHTNRNDGNNASKNGKTPFESSLKESTKQE